MDLKVFVYIYIHVYIFQVELEKIDKKSISQNKMDRSHNTCAVAICSSPKDAIYHRFPKDQSLQKIWIQACKRDGPEVDFKRFEDHRPLTENWDNQQ